MLDSFDSASLRVYVQIIMLYIVGPSNKKFLTCKAFCHIIIIPEQTASSKLLCTFPNLCRTCCLKLKDIHVLNCALLCLVFIVSTRLILLQLPTDYLLQQVTETFWVGTETSSLAGLRGEVCSVRLGYWVILSICLSVCPFANLSACLSSCPCVHASFCAGVCLFCTSVCPSAQP